MYLKKAFYIFVFIFLAILQAKASHLLTSNYISIDLVCSTVKLMKFEEIGDLKTCSVTPSLTVTNETFRVRNVVINGSEEEVTSDSIEAIYIENSLEMKFLPLGIKMKFPKLKALRIDKSNLLHVDQHAMEQFGSELLYVRFFETRLRILEGDLFIHNTNLIHVDFSNNKLESIEPELFETFDQMKDLKTVDFLNCGCINQTGSRKISSEVCFLWSYHECNIKIRTAIFSKVITQKYKDFLNSTLHGIKNNIKRDVLKLLDGRLNNHSSNNNSSSDAKNDFFFNYDVSTTVSVDINGSAIIAHDNNTEIEKELFMMKEQIELSNLALKVVAAMILLTTFVTVSCTTFILKRMKRYM